MFSEQLHEKCEEFFDLLSAEHRTEEVEGIIDHLTELLVDEIDGRTNQEDLLLAEEVELQMKELWDLLPFAERKTNINLRDYYDDLMDTLSAVLDDSTSYSDGEDLEEYDFESEDSESDEEEDYE